MALTNIAVRHAKAATKPVKLFDGGGLFLYVTAKGAKLWRLKYRYQGKEKLISLGSYPEITLQEARERRHESRQLLAKQIDPSAHRQASKAAERDKHSNSFEVVTQEWLRKQVPTWSASHTKNVTNRLKKDILPLLGQLPIADITTAQVLAAVRSIEQRGAVETAHRVLGVCGQIFRYAVATGRVDRDITADLRGALTPIQPAKHFAAEVNPRKLAGILRAIDAYDGTLVVRCALQLAPMLFVRPGELRTAEWSAIDFEQARWCYRVTKTQTDHIVPLSTQAIALLRVLQPVTGNGRYLFPSIRTTSRPMSDNTIVGALRRLGIDKQTMTGHGFRAVARTLLDEVLHYRVDLIEHQLAHTVKDPNGRAYNRTTHLPERTKMMQHWSDYLEALKTTDN